MNRKGFNSGVDLCLVLSFILLAVCYSTASAQQDGSMADGDAPSRDETFNAEIGLSGLYSHHMDYTGDAANQIAIGGDFVYSFHQLVHNNDFRTRASKVVVPKGFIAAQGQSGPTYKTGPDHLSFRVSAAGLVTKTIAIGGAMLLDQVDYKLVSTPFSLDEKAFAGFIDIYASRKVMLRELIAFGSLEYSTETNPSGSRNSMGTTRFEHTLAAVGNEGFGYVHEFHYINIERSYSLVNFNQYFEFASSPEFSIEPQLRIEALIPQGSGSYYRLGLGVGFNVYFTPKAVLRFVPLYERAMETNGLATLSLQARLGIRF